MEAWSGYDLYRLLTVSEKTCTSLVVKGEGDKD